MYAVTLFFDCQDSTLHYTFVEANRPKEAIRKLLKSKDWTDYITDEDLSNHLHLEDDRGNPITDEDADRILHALVSGPQRRLRIFINELTNPLEIRYRPTDTSIDDGLPGFIAIEDITSLVDLYQYDSDDDEENEGPMSLDECFAAIGERYVL